MKQRESTGLVELLLVVVSSWIGAGLAVYATVAFVEVVKKLVTGE